jgi:ribosomal protein L16 Arg81 hydroxylase
VRILISNNQSDTLSSSVPLVLDPGDMLYLPPRVLHHGISLSSNCMTLSVGCRAPAASDLVASIAAAVVPSLHATAVQRYTDVESSITMRNKIHSPTLTDQVKNSMKKLVHSAVEAILNDDMQWDSLVGKMVTEPLRTVDHDDEKFPEHDAENADENYHYSTSHDQADQSEERVNSYRWIFQKYCDGQANLLGDNDEDDHILLQRRGGASMATSIVKDIEHAIVRFFVDGHMYEISTTETTDDVIQILNQIERGIPIKVSLLKTISPELESVLIQLLNDGYLIPRMERSLSTC